MSAAVRTGVRDPMLRVAQWLSLDEAQDVRWAPAWRAAGMMWRYGTSAAGPIAIAGTHFIAALIILHGLSRAEFGLFSFLLVAAPFCLSITGALVGAPLSARMTAQGGIDDGEFATFLKMNGLLSLAAGAAVGVAMYFAGVPLVAAPFLGAYTALMVLRWFARAYAYIDRRPFRAIVSDFSYAGVLLVSLALLYLTGLLSIELASVALAASAAISMLTFGSDYLRRQLAPGNAGSLAAYRPFWRDLARWSALGVVLTELTANAHAYLVTFLAGPASFALLALGSLVMRPVSLVFSALPDMERPVMARAIAAENTASALRTVNEFRTATGAVWAATLLLAGALLTWFPQLLLKKGYDETQVVWVIAIWGAIMLVRSIRTPQSVFLQAAGEFRGLARAGGYSSVVSLVLTLFLLVTLGPIVSLCGILAGDIAMTLVITRQVRAWKACHA